MGVGTYFFSAPAGDDWSRMVYVDLEPVFWSTEVDRRNAEFNEFLIKDPLIQSELGGLERIAPGSSLERLEGIRQSWNQDIGYLDDESVFLEDQSDDQHELVYAGLGQGFDTSISRPDIHCEQIADACVLATVGRMNIVQAYSYYGDQLAIMVTPRRDLQDDIYELEQGEPAFESGWPAYQRASMRRHNLALLNLKRSLKTGALCREMNRVFDQVLLALHANYLEKHMSFRKRAWSRGSYIGSESHAKNEKLLSAQSNRAPSTLKIGV